MPRASGTRWTKEDERFLAKAYPNHEIADIAVALGRSCTSVQVKASRLGISNSDGARRVKWTPEDDAALASMYRKMPMKCIGRIIGRTTRGCYRRVERLRHNGDERFIKRK